VVKCGISKAVDRIERRAGRNRLLDSGGVTGACRIEYRNICSRRAILDLRGQDPRD
jgi:hypothetical protein